MIKPFLSPCCGRFTEKTTAGDGVTEREANPGDKIVCASCGGLLFVEADGSKRVIGDSELLLMVQNGGQPELQMLLAVLHMRRRAAATPLPDQGAAGSA